MKKNIFSSSIYRFQETSKWHIVAWAKKFSTSSECKECIMLKVWDKSRFSKTTVIRNRTKFKESWWTDVTFPWRSIDGGEEWMVREGRNTKVIVRKNETSWYSFSNDKQQRQNLNSHMSQLWGCDVCQTKTKKLVRIHSRLEWTDNLPSS